MSGILELTTNRLWTHSFKGSVVNVEIYYAYCIFIPIGTTVYVVNGCVVFFSIYSIHLSNCKHNQYLQVPLVRKSFFNMRIG